MGKIKLSSNLEVEVIDSAKVTELLSKADEKRANRSPFKAGDAIHFTKGENLILVNNPFKMKRNGVVTEYDCYGIVKTVKLNGLDTENVFVPLRTFASKSDNDFVSGTPKRVEIQGLCAENSLLTEIFSAIQTKVASGDFDVTFKRSADYFSLYEGKLSTFARNLSAWG